MDDLFTHDQLRENGYSRAEILRQLESGRLIRVHHGIYTTRDLGANLVVEARALLRRLGPDAVISHLAAAAAHDLPFPLWMLDRVRATRPVPSGQKYNGAGFYPCPLAPEDVVEIDGLPVTSLERTVIDVARIVPEQWGVAPVDVAMARGVTRQELEATIDRGKRRPGNARARRAVALGDPLSESPGESRSRAIMQRYSVPPPKLQVEIFDECGNFVGRVDFLWEEVGLIGEFDGASKYALDIRGPEQARLSEAARQQELEALGYHVLRWNWEELAHPERLAFKIQTAYSSARADAHPRGSLRQPPRWAA